VEPSIGFGIDVSFHLPGVPSQNEQGVGFHSVVVMGLYEN